MRIGIDFDNTIANYDCVFRKIAIKYNLISKNWHGNKQQLKKEILKKKNIEVWKRLQGLVYGRYMYLAKVEKGVESFLLKSNLGICD